LTEELYASEYTSIANIDFSETVIKQMQERHAEKTTLAWEVMDVSEKLNYPDESFDVCIDKGCLDSILCGDSSTVKVNDSIYHVLRVLKKNGTFMLISHWPPEKWLGYLEIEAYHWSISVFAVPRPVVGVPPESSGNGIRDTTLQSTYSDPVAVHYVYVCRKLGDRNEKQN
jgi:ubiquinone/menaquinone biosynthesis C-methylase UbiE